MIGCDCGTCCETCGHYEDCIRSEGEGEVLDYQLLTGDALEQLRTLPDGSADCIVTSPPYYGLRDYGHPGQYGREATPAAYIDMMRAVFAEARRVLADDGTMWLNLGDTYGPGKQLLGIPWRAALALQGDGWTLRNAVVWHKPNGIPSSVKDRLSTRYEQVFLLTKGAAYHFDLDAVREPYAGDRKPSRRAHYGGNKQNTARGVWVDTGRGRNPGDMWAISTRPYPAAHFATFPIDLPLRCIRAGCKPSGSVLDPFSGSGTTGAAALALGRQYIGIDLVAEYHDLARARFSQVTTPLA